MAVIVHALDNTLVIVNTVIVLAVHKESSMEPSGLKLVQDAALVRSK
jgi:hypothetical protein